MGVGKKDGKEDVTRYLCHCHNSFIAKMLYKPLSPERQARLKCCPTEYVTDARLARPGLRGTELVAGNKILEDGLAVDMPTNPTFSF